MKPTTAKVDYHFFDRWLLLESGLLKFQGTFFLQWSPTYGRKRLKYND
jgi:hypothetical protein